MSKMTRFTRPAHVELADHFANPGPSQHPLRVRLTSVEEFNCLASTFDIDALVLVATTREGSTRRIRPSEVAAIARTAAG